MYASREAIAGVEAAARGEREREREMDIVQIKSAGTKTKTSKAGCVNDVVPAVRGSAQEASTGAARERETRSGKSRDMKCTGAEGPKRGWMGKRAMGREITTEQAGPKSRLKGKRRRNETRSTAAEEGKG